MTERRHIELLERKLADSLEHSKRLTDALKHTGHTLRNVAGDLKVQARMLQGLQGYCYKTSDKLDNYAIQILTLSDTSAEKLKGEFGVKE